MKTPIGFTNEVDFLSDRLIPGIRTILDRHPRPIRARLKLEYPKHRLLTWPKETMQRHMLVQGIPKMQRRRKIIEFRKGGKHFPDLPLVIPSG